METRHLHIALVGGAPTPVYQGIAHVNPDQVILICSERSEKIAQNIIGQVPTLGEHIKPRKIEDEDMPRMEQEIRGIVSEAKASGMEVSYNLSSGLKVWTILFDRIVREVMPEAWVFCLSQDGLLFNMNTGKSDEKVKFDMDAQFALLGHEMASYTSFADYTREDMSVLSKVSRWGFGRMYHAALKDLTNAFCDGSDDPGRPYRVVLNADNSLGWNPEEHCFTGKIQGEAFRLSSPHVWHIVLNTGWFEVFVARLLSEHFPAEDIRLNCRFVTSDNKDKNEVDIIVNMGQRLLFVECKTQVYEITAVDKFSAVVHNYGGLGSKALFVTNWEMRKDAAEKCDEQFIKRCHTYQPDLTPAQRHAALSRFLEEIKSGWNVK